MKRKLHWILIPFFFGIIILFLPSCAAELLEGLALEEEAGLMAESGVEVAAAGELVVSDEAAFCSALERVTLEESTFNNPRLFVASESEPFAEVLSEDRIRIIKYGRDLTLPGDIYTVKGDLVNVRVGPGLNYNVFKQVSSGQLVLVRTLNNGWYQVQIGDNTFGYIFASLLVPAIASSHNNSSNSNNHYITPTYKVNSCSFCNGSGFTTCHSCGGSGKVSCSYCSGTGTIFCNNCSGKGYHNCNSCGGQGKLACATCNGYGYLICGSCHGSGIIRDRFGRLFKCRRCHGYGKLQCYSCHGQGSHTCSHCGGKGIQTCSYCNGYGKKTCSYCNGNGYSTCRTCNGRGKITCSYCNGNGNIQIRTN